MDLFIPQIKHVHIRPLNLTSKWLRPCWSCQHLQHFSDFHHSTPTQLNR